jgi:UDP-glucose 4-epimerase
MREKRSNREWANPMYARTPSRGATIDDSSRKVAIIGGASLVGSHIVELLQDVRPAWTLLIFDNFRTGDEEALRSVVDPSKSTIAALDVRDEAGTAAALEGCDIVFHLAAMLSMSFPTNTREAIEVNVLGSLNVIEACAAQGTRLVLSSSAGGVYGIPVEGAVTESSPFAHSSLPTGTAMYGSGKILAENICRDRSSTFPDFSWAALRYTSIYGRRQHNRGRHTARLAENLERLAAGHAARFDRPPEEAHDYLDARDAALCNLLAAEADASMVNRAFNVASGRATTNAELAEILGRVTRSETPPEWTRFDGDIRPAVRYDPGAASASLGFDAQVRLEEGLSVLYESLQEGAAL